MKKERVYRVRVRRSSGKICSFLFLCKDPNKAARKVRTGKVLSVTKVSHEELFRLGPRVPVIPESGSLFSLNPQGGERRA